MAVCSLITARQKKDCDQSRRIRQRGTAMDVETSAGGAHIAAQEVVSPVSSHNEWDPLEEIIVGRLEGSVIPSNHPVVTCNIPGMAARAQSLFAGFHYPKIMVEPAQRELDGF